MGAEVQAIAEAELTIETAQAVKGAAMLNALIFVDEVQAARAEVAAAVTTTVAAEVVRSLIVAGVIADDELEPAQAVVRACEARLVPRLVESRGRAHAA